ncbi:hypothetical protein H6P81_005075 [Aristolochia fimbriata]|uniref:Uncharacterized protein n=1 Tax=Aristolochia fimbriata TaxID=158543 RepID=A0AAV7EWB8_ARIFI|nr:hypothetical protein H6P81_005075 [Aristolochia fimbriata]
MRGEESLTLREPSRTVSGDPCRLSGKRPVREGDSDDSQKSEYEQKRQLGRKRKLRNGKKIKGSGRKKKKSRKVEEDNENFFRGGTGQDPKHGIFLSSRDFGFYVADDREFIRRTKGRSWESDGGERNMTRAGEEERRPARNEAVERMGDGPEGGKGHSPTLQRRRLLQNPMHHPSSLSVKPEERSIDRSKIKMGADRDRTVPPNGLRSRSKNRNHFNLLADRITTAPSSSSRSERGREGREGREGSEGGPRSARVMGAVGDACPGTVAVERTTETSPPDSGPRLSPDRQTHTARTVEPTRLRRCSSCPPTSPTPSLNATHEWSTLDKGFAGVDALIMSYRLLSAGAGLRSLNSHGFFPRCARAHAMGSSFLGVFTRFQWVTVPKELKLKIIDSSSVKSREEVRDYRVGKSNWKGTDWGVLMKAERSEKHSGPLLIAAKGELRRPQVGVEEEEPKKTNLDSKLDPILIH